MAQADTAPPLTVDVIDQQLKNKLRYRRARGATGPLYGLRYEVDHLLDQRFYLETATKRALTMEAPEIPESVRT